jgi:hypothetical protein
VETTESIPTKPIRRLLILAAIFTCMALAACADVAGTGAEASMRPSGTTSYMTQRKTESDSDPAESDLSPAYEWFY